MINSRILFLALILLSGCFSSAPEVGRSELTGKINSEIYLTRASLGKVEFEQYRLIGTKLFYECGEIKRGRNAPQEQNMGAVSDETLSSLAYLITNLNYSAAAMELDGPGDNSNLMDPGKAMFTFDIAGKKSELQTSVDCVQNATTESSEKLLRIVEQIRGAAKGALCGNINFYGIGMTG